MSASILGLEELLRTIAAAASERRPLPPAIRDLGTGLARRIADRLDAGADLRTAFDQELPEGLADLLAGPRPGVEESALLAAELLRLRREDRTAAIAQIAHPLFALVAVAGTVGLIGSLGPSPAAGWLAATACLGVGGLLVALAGSGRLSERLPWLGALRLHARLAGRYERAALAARWKLPEERLAPLLGADLAALAPVLADPGATAHCRRLAGYHRQAAERARRRLWFSVMALGYVAGGCLLLAGAVPVMDQWIELMTSLGELPN